MKVLTPEQMEDAAINDAISTAVGLHQRQQRRELLNNLRAVFGPEITQARLNGRVIDAEKFAERALRLVRTMTNG